MFFSHFNPWWFDLSDCLILVPKEHWEGFYLTLVLAKSGLQVMLVVLHIHIYPHGFLKSQLGKVR
jgi:hypothetical protein